MTVIGVVAGTELVPEAGRWVTMARPKDGGAEPVLNWLTKSAREFPAKSWTPDVAATETVEDAGRVAVKETDRPSADKLTPVLRRAEPLKSARVVELMVDAFMGSEKTRFTAAFSPTLEVFAPGVTERIVGGVVSPVPAAVVNLEKKFPPMFPTKSRT